MAFVDEAKIRVLAGPGGSGSASFHHEPFKPKGGPDGGDGGDGGSVVLRADRSIGTLLEVRNHPHIKAERGGNGQRNRRAGARGNDRIVLVPPGTVVYDGDVLVADLASEGDSYVGAKGGRGGRGNTHFVSPTRRSPAFAEKGEPGEDKWIRLELRLLADVGLVGFPNAGKSTLISRISAARPKIADYPFTTLEPNLGVVRVSDSSFVVADIPGLVEGAHEGKGLGHRFLRHVSRAAVLVIMADLASFDRDPVEDVEVLRNELANFEDDLGERPQIIVASKVDAGRDRLDEFLARFPEALPISAVTGEGLDALLGRLAEEVDRVRKERPAAVGYIRHVVREDPIRVAREGESWRVRGRRAERAVEATDMDNAEAVERLQRRLISMGVEKALAEAGAKEGDEVLISEMEFNFEPD
jgi:GTP-binding protein